MEAHKRAELHIKLQSNQMDRSRKISWVKAQTVMFKVNFTFAMNDVELE